jgi:hypothetical protein
MKIFAGIILFVLLSVKTGLLYSQSPQAISYQAVVRDNGGKIVPNQIVAFRFSIHDITTSGTVVYSERHVVTSNQLGLVTLNIGTGTALSGSFSTIGWGSASKFLQVDLDYNAGTSYITMGTTQMLSVPYALFAGSSAGSASGDLSGNYPSPVVSKINGSLLGATTSATTGQVLKYNGTAWDPASDNNSGGTVTSVGLSMPAGFTVASSPVTGTGTIAVSTTLTGPVRGTGTGLTTGTTNLQTEVNNVLKIVNGGTNSSTALAGSGIMVSNGTSIVQGLAGTSTTVLHGNAGSTPTYSAVSLTADVTGVLPVVNLPSLAGDVTGAINVNTVARLRGRTVSTTAPTNGQVLAYNTTLTQWEPQTIASGSGWSLTGNTGINDALHFIGTTNSAALNFKVNNQKAGRIDHAAFLANTYFGYQAGNVNSDFGTDNTGIGYQALLMNTDGRQNTAVGEGAMYSHINGLGSTAVGFNSQYYIGGSASGSFRENTSIGNNSLRGSLVPSANTGSQNTAAGNFALYNNSSGSLNTAIGYTALYENTSGGDNTGLGFSALQNNTTGTFNTAIGSGTHMVNISGTLNTACGSQALYNTSTGSGNTAVGVAAGSTVNNGDNNTFIGYGARANAANYTNATAIGYLTQVTADHQMRFGNSAVNSIGGQVGWSTFSDGRFKRNVKENIPGLSFIMKLRPVSYNLNISAVKQPKIYARNGEIINNIEKTENSNSTNIYSGFIAQEVEQAANSVGYQFSGIDAPKNATDHYSLRYAEFVVPMVKAIQEQQLAISNLTEKLKSLEIQNEKLKADNEAFRKDLLEIKNRLQIQQN